MLLNPNKLHVINNSVIIKLQIRETIMEEYKHSYNVREGEVLRCFDADMYDALCDLNLIEKSANTKVSEYVISLTTQDSFKTYKNYAFSLNELEATFSAEDDSLIELVLRDTSVHKKITLKSDKSILTYVKGQDTVGKNSEINDITSKEHIYSVTINEQSFEAPFDIEVIYEHLTGVNLDDARNALGDEVLESTQPINWWNAFIKDDSE